MAMVIDAASQDFEKRAAPVVGGKPIALALSAAVLVVMAIFAVAASPALDPAVMVLIGP